MNNTKTLMRLLRYIRGFTGILVLSLILSLTVTGIMLYVPILIGQCIDCIGMGTVDFEKMLPILRRTAVVIMIAALGKWVVSVLNNRMTYGVVRMLRRDAFHHLQELPVSYTDSHPTGDIVSRVITDADAVADGLLLGFTQLFTGVLTIVETLVFMLRMNLTVTAMVVLLTPLSLLVAKFIASKSYKYFQAQSAVRGEQTALLNERIAGVRVIQAFSHEDRSLADFDEINGRLGECSLKATFFSSLVNPTTRFVSNLIYAAVALTGAFFVLGGSLTVGGLAVFLSYASQYAKPFNEISAVVTELQNSIACSARLFALMDAPAEVADGKDVLTDDGAVGLEDVSFSYRPDKKLIEHLTFTAAKGEHIAIVGPTGCGKTTLINLLMRFYDVNSGAVTFAGKDIRTVTRGSLRARYGMVLQETWLKSGTIRENLMLGAPDATEEEMITAAKAAHADSFIRRLPQGYDTVLREDGEGLSAGQRQLLCIARVMLCDPPALILDEATSSIDTRTEAQIQAAFKRMTAGKTSFIVAHRLSTIREADKILVMRDGTVIEIGNHDTLLANGGFYANLYNSQFAT